MLGHTGPISDFDWSMMNDFLMSCSLDSTLRIWDTRTFKCIRTITHVSPLLSCLFHPINNNVLFV
jgi:WD40 repeat protein